MAITYQLQCGICQSSHKLFIGKTLESFESGEPAFELACCEKCKTLTHTNTKKCPHCGTPAECNKLDPNSWLLVWRKFLEDIRLKKSHETGFRIIQLATNKINRRIYCPRCKQMAVKATPVLYYD